MDNVEKLRVMLAHWLEHNQGHVEEFEKWQATMAEEGRSNLADRLAEAIAAMAEVNNKLAAVLTEAGGPVSGHHHHGDNHHHHH